ncbi:MAG: hypothetical protein LLF76_03150 [Planctomycetaceae bacterium]|nr:hypothetical protein [Planctomycetaceae bacterium]
MKCEFIFRPLGDWGQERTRHPKRSQFKSSYSNTLELLNRELGMLGVRRAVIGLDMPESMIRNDGLPRADARPASAAISLHFESKYGPLRYATDVFDKWQDNLRAIALGLEALRQVDRYGITKKGQQYTGWKQLPEVGSPVRDYAAALAFICEHSGQVAAWVEMNEDNVQSAYRRAALNLHPDKGGDAEQFRILTIARDIVLAEVQRKAGGA